VVLAGDDPASAVYVRNKEKAANEVGIRGAVHRLPASVSEAELLELVEQLNHDETVDGILVQLPLPHGLAADRIVERIEPRKDVDGLHPVNIGALWSGKAGLVPCTPLGCLRLLDEEKVPLEGARALIIGRSNLVGKPLGALLLARNATVTLAHSRTRDLAERCREAELLIAAVGSPGLVRGSWIRPGAVVLDVGTSRLESGKLAGDVDFAAAEAVASAITPVPGGVGPMTIAMLLENTVRAATQRLKAR
jgi:methylenetetrahydrofolate dehydrogenase (NADP+)/methenyltetrahydrofolate cyclohydrolase